MFRRRRSTEDFAEEIRAHLELEADELQAEGLSGEEAHRRARVEFGSVRGAEERFSLRGRAVWIENFGRDIRFALRQLLRNPGFALVAIVTLALGIGASTAIFSVADAVLLRPLPYPGPQQIVRIWEQAPDGHRMNLADANFQDFRAQNNTLSALAEYEYGLASVSGGSEPARANIASVSRDFFRTLGVEPVRGRLFTAEEQRPHGAPAVVVSYGYWQQYLGGEADLSRFHLQMEGGIFPVVGVMPPGFDYPSGVAAWIPSELNPGTPSRTAHNWRGIGRVRDGVTAGQALANLSGIARRIRQQYGKDVDLSDVAVVPLADAMVGNVQTALLTLAGAVGLLLLVACANVAGLLLARTSARRRELAMRAALGASRERLVRQFLAESLVLSLDGGAVGILLAAWGVRVLPAILPANLPRQEGIAMNPAVLLFAVAATLAVAFGLGLFTAVRASSGDMQPALSAGSRASGASLVGQRLRSILVTGEIAATLVILAGAGLLGRSFLRLIFTSPGFRQQNLITMEFSPPVPMNEGLDQAAIARQVHLIDQIVARLRVIPGAESVGLAGNLPVAAGDNLPDGDFLILGGQRPPANFDEFGRMAQNPAMTGHALYDVASQGYFHTLGIPLLRGRMFGEQDSPDAPNVALVSEALARLRWPNQDPIGQLIEFGNMDGNLRPLRIVGIVGDVRAQGLDAPASPIIYVDYSQRGMNANSSPVILVRSSAPAGEIVSPARRIFHRLAPQIPVRFSTFAQDMGGWLAERRFLLLLVGVFATAALVLAAVGIYGVVAFFVARRTQEIGIRMAIGATRRDLLLMVLREGARMAATGVGIGLVASLAVTRLISALLYGVRANDPLTFAAVAALLALVALAASYIPAVRALRVDPMTALRCE